MGVLAIITARGGSKSIPGKNIKPLAGQPLIVYTFQAALQSRKLERIVLSTDCAEIAAVARQCGIQVPFMRPSELAQDTTPGVAPVVHAIEWLRDHERYTPDYVMLLQPTSPLRTTEDIDAAVALATEKNADAVVGVTPAEIHPYWSKQIDAQGRMVNMFPLEKSDANRQELPAAYAVNGAIYLVRTHILLRNQSLFPPETYVYCMPPERSMDINTPWEFHLVELVLKDKARRENH